MLCSPENFPSMLGQIEKCYGYIETAINSSSPKTAIHRINNKIRKIIEKQPRRNPLLPSQQTKMSFP